jgi:hypothetical protein
MHNGSIGHFYWQKRLQHRHGLILWITVNRAFQIVSVASFESYVPIGCRPPFMRYWQPLLANTTVTCYQWHPENDCQRSVNSFRTCIPRHQRIVQIFTWITVLLGSLLGKNGKCRRWKTDTELIDIANCLTSKSTLWVAENMMLIRYYSHIANSRSLYESIHGPSA